MPKNDKIRPFLPFETILPSFSPTKAFHDYRFRKRNIWASDYAKKKSWLDNVEKSLRSFKKKFTKKKLIFGYPKFRRFETFTKCQISLKISFIVSKIYFRGLKAFRLILGTKFLIRP